MVNAILGHNLTKVDPQGWFFGPHHYLEITNYNKFYEDDGQIWE